VCLWGGDPSEFGCIKYNMHAGYVHCYRPPVSAKIRVWVGLHLLLLSWLAGIAPKGIEYIEYTNSIKVNVSIENPPNSICTKPTRDMAVNIPRGFTNSLVDTNYVFKGIKNFKVSQARSYHQILARFCLVCSSRSRSQ
jgi:hypothetical protein